MKANEFRIGNIIEQGRIDLLELRVNDYGKWEKILGLLNQNL